MNTDSYISAILHPSLAYILKVTRRLLGLQSLANGMRRGNKAPHPVESAPFPKISWNPILRLLLITAHSGCKESWTTPERARVLFTKKGIDTARVMSSLGSAATLFMIN